MSLSKYIFKELSGKKVNELLKGTPIIKFINNNGTHDGMIYKTGLNDITPLNPIRYFRRGGIRVTLLDNFGIG
jgi:hypothetical protein